MDLERTMEFIVENLAAVTVRQQKTEEGLAALCASQQKTDLSIRGLRTIVHTGMRILVKLEQNQVKLEQAQIRTEASLSSLDEYEKEPELAGQNSWLQMALLPHLDPSQSEEKLRPSLRPSLPLEHFSFF